jgi:hypothetical protein
VALHVQVAVVHPGLQAAPEVHRVQLELAAAVHHAQAEAAPPETEAVARIVAEVAVVTVAAHVAAREVVLLSAVLNHRR